MVECSKVNNYELNNYSFFIALLLHFEKKVILYKAINDFVGMKVVYMRIIQLGFSQLSLVHLISKYKDSYPKKLNINEYKKSSINS